MTRVMAVVLVFALLTGISGVHEVSLGADQGEATSTKHRRKIAERVAKIPPNLNRPTRQNSKPFCWTRRLTPSRCRSSRSQTAERK